MGIFRFTLLDLIRSIPIDYTYVLAANYWLFTTSFWEESKD